MNLMHRGQQETEGYRAQYERIKRFLARVENFDSDQIDYEDDLWSFFIHCWTLKDWVRKSQHPLSKNIENEVKKYPSITICADLANRTKHLQSGKHERHGAIINKNNVTIYATTSYVHLGDQSSCANNREIEQSGHVEYDYIIETDTGETFSALKIARDAVKSWGIILGL